MSVPCSIIIRNRIQRKTRPLEKWIVNSKPTISTSHCSHYRKIPKKTRKINSTMTCYFRLLTSRTSSRLKLKFFCVLRRINTYQIFVWSIFPENVNPFGKFGKNINRKGIDSLFTVVAASSSSALAFSFSRCSSDEYLRHFKIFVSRNITMSFTSRFARDYFCRTYK